MLNSFLLLFIPHVMRLDLVSVGCPYLMHTVTHSLYVFSSLPHLRESNNVIRDYLDNIQTRNSFPTVTFPAHRAPLAASQCHKQRHLLHSPWAQQLSTLPPTVDLCDWVRRAHFKFSTDDGLLGKPSLVFDSCSFTDRSSHTLRRKPQLSFPHPCHPQLSALFFLK